MEREKPEMVTWCHGLFNAGMFNLDNFRTCRARTIQRKLPFRITLRLGSASTNEITVLKFKRVSISKGPENLIMNILLK